MSNLKKFSKLTLKIIGVFTSAALLYYFAVAFYMKGKDSMIPEHFAKDWGINYHNQYSKNPEEFHHNQAKRIDTLIIQIQILMQKIQRLEDNVKSSNERTSQAGI